MSDPCLPTRTGCAIVGGGPGGMFLALLLARRGVEVTLLESHHDFDRDFRGDTVHPSTLEILDRMGLANEMLKLPHARMHELRLTTPRATYSMVSFRRLPTRFPYIMVLPQSTMLDFLAQDARKYPNLRLILGAQANGLIQDRGVVHGVRFQHDGSEHELRATLTVGADGRFSRLRKLAGLEPIRTAPPMDVVWFRLPRKVNDTHDLNFYLDRGRMCIVVERQNDWQIGFVIPKGGYQQIKAGGLDALRQEVAAIVPWLADRVSSLTDWSSVTLLSVESSRLSRWYRPGLLLIGDAAHVMSPVGGVGISYAIQDAVATANILGEPLLRGEVRPQHLAAVQERREWPVRVIQTFQGLMQRQLVAHALDKGKPFQLPWFIRLITGIPILRDLPARLIAFGLRSERPRFLY